MLAYVFWHRPAGGVDGREYEEAQRGFHVSLRYPSACFRLAELPFSADAENDNGGYEDWYLVEDWAALGELNAHAVNAVRDEHDQAALLAAGGWGAIYELVRGAAEIPAGVEWLDKPRGESSAEFVAALPYDSIWRRQLVLGPAPEFCCSTANVGSRRRL